MNNINFIKVLFAQMTFFIIVLGGLINTVEKYLPVFITRTFRYGKFAYQGTNKSIIKPIEVPKAWFRHFYIFSSLASSLALYFAINSYILKYNIPTWVRQGLNVASGNHPYSTVTPAATLVALFLLTIQCYRRLFDTHFISVFGKNSRMNLTHYMVGFIHYFGAILAILAEAPNFTLLNEKYHFKWTDISFLEITGSILFLWAWWHQYKVTKILANLRKNVNGKVVSDKHYMPKGDWFEYVSSPHLLSEVLMYLALTIILWKNLTWRFVFIWVLCNQTETALLSHWWYRDTFPNYPKHRKALVPYVL